MYTGQAFKQPLEVVPKHVMRAAMVLLQSFTRMVSSANIIQSRGAPIVMYPLVLGAQVLHAAMPGHEPSIDDLNLSDDARLLVPSLTDSSGSGPAPMYDRRAYFQKDGNRQVCAGQAWNCQPADLQARKDRGPQLASTLKVFHPACSLIQRGLILADVCHCIAQMIIGHVSIMHHPVRH